MTVTGKPLDGGSVVAFVGSSDLATARAFFGDRLGLPVLDDSPFAVVFAAGGAELRVTQVDEVVAAPYTALGWSVPDIEAAVDAATAAGVTFRRFEGMDQDDRGLWTTPGGDRVAWFQDPDGNLLSISEEAGSPP
jgi:catechol 2,3-dioxygenase-like lactoylglutathione lyase family enzyme